MSEHAPEGSQTRVNSQIFGRKVSAPRKLRNRKLPPDAVSVLRQLPVWGLWQRRGEMKRESSVHDRGD